MPDVVTPLTLPSSGDLPPIVPVDWAYQVVLATTYQTIIARSATTLTEERRALSLRPTRDLRVVLTGMSQADTWRLETFLMRRVRSRGPVPLYCDQSLVTASSTGTTIHCDTTFRRFHAGGRVLVYKPWSNGIVSVSQADVAEYALIDSLTASSLTLKSSGLTNTYPAGCIVMPVIDAEASLDGGFLSLLTDRVGSAEITANEVLGPSALPQTEDGDPTGYDTHTDGHPILSLDPNWDSAQETLLTHDGTSDRAGRTNHTWLQGPAHRTGHRLIFSALDREEADKIRRFFDSRVGMLKPFWLVSPQTYFTILARPGAIDVELTEFFDITALRYIAIVMKDGTVTIHEADSTSVTGGMRRIELSPTPDAFDVADVERISPAHFVRFAQDTLTETWDTDGVCAIDLETVEVISEQSVTITDA